MGREGGRGVQIIFIIVGHTINGFQAYGGCRLKDQPGVEHASQGIVIAAGKSMRLANAYVTLRVLRDHMQSTLPVEIWYFGAEEMDANTKATLEVSQNQGLLPSLPCNLF